MRVVLIYILLCLTGICNAQNVVISGKSKSYIGQTLEVFRHKDFISELPQKITEAKVDSLGNFTISFSVDDITKVYIPSGRFIVEYMAYPDMEDTVLLPRYWDKPKDMYFVPRKVWAKNTSSDNKDLNNLIFNFERDLKALNGNKSRRIAAKDAGVLDEIIPFLNTKYKSDNGFFNDYKRYSLAMTEFMVYADYPDKIINKYFKDKDLLEGNTAYTDLFKKVFYKHIDFYRFRKRSDINGKILCDELHEIIETKGIDSEKLCKHIALNLLKDACHSPVINQGLIFDALRYFRDEKGDSDEKAIVENILSKATKLAKGYKAPFIKGYDINGNVKNTADMKGKYIYICFYQAGNPRCIKDLKTIRSIQRAIHFLEVIFVCDRAKKPACINDLKNIGMQNNILLCDDIEKVKKDFQVMVVPEYFLIDKNGNFIKSHTAKPDNHLFKQLNLIKIKEIRAGNIKEKKLFK